MIVDEADRLAIDGPQQGRGLGVALRADAMRRTVRAADEVGLCAVLVDASDARAAAVNRGGTRCERTGDPQITHFRFTRAG